MTKKIVKEIVEYPQIKLDIKKDRKDNSFNVLNTDIRSIVIVSATSSDAVMHAFFPETSERVLLKVGVPVSFKEARTKCILEWEAQTGVSVNIETSAYTHFAHYEFSISALGNVFSITGSNFTQELKTIAATPTLILSANSNRVLANIANRSASTFYFGTLANCNDANYKNLCHKLEAGGSMEWSNLAGLYFRTESGTIVDGAHVLEEVK